MFGRFLSEDPIGLVGGINQYAFAGDDPINGRDPNGTCDDLLAWAMGVLAEPGEGTYSRHCTDLPPVIVWGHRDPSWANGGGKITSMSGMIAGVPTATAAEDVGHKAVRECRNAVLKLTGAVALDLVGGAELWVAGRAAVGFYRTARFSTNFALRVPANIVRYNNNKLISGLGNLATAYFTGSANGIGFGYAADRLGDMSPNVWGYVPLPGFATGAGIYDVRSSCLNPNP
jgi:hypothetical protein